MDNINKELLVACASVFSFPEDIENLLDEGADIEYSDKYGDTPLIKSIKKCCYGISEFLIERGADINHSDNANQSPLFYASMNSNCKVAKLLLDKGADIETVASGGVTAIFPALYNANKEMFLLFLYRGANIHHKSDKGLDIVDYCYDRSSDDDKIQVRKYIQSIYPGNTFKCAKRK